MLKLRVFFLFVFAALVTSVPLPVRAQSNCAPQQRKEFTLTAIDKNGNIIDSLRADQLSLKVGNSPATISDLVFQTRQPLDIAVLIDASISQEKVLPLAKAAAQRFITFFALAGDRVAIVPFSDKPTDDPVLTSDFATAIKVIDGIKIVAPPGYIGGGMVVSTSPPKNPLVPGSTSLWDAVRSATQALFVDKAEKRRRVMLLFTDGIDTSSSNKLNAAIEDALKHDMAVFSIGLGDANFGVDRDPLKKLSEQTGGVASFPKKTEDMESVLSEIAKRLRGNYVIGYCTELNNRGKIQVEVIDPAIRQSKPVLAYKRGDVRQ